MEPLKRSRRGADLEPGSVNDTIQMRTPRVRHAVKPSSGMTIGGGSACCAVARSLRDTAEDAYAKLAGRLIEDKQGSIAAAGRRLTSA